MVARRDVPPPVPPHLQPRAVWEAAFEREFVKLRPHLENLHKVLRQHTVGALAQHTLDSDPVKAARAWDASLKR